jgi:hypothetical protein
MAHHAGPICGAESNPSPPQSCLVLAQKSLGRTKLPRPALPGGERVGVRGSARVLNRSDPLAAFSTRTARAHVCSFCSSVTFHETGVFGRHLWLRPRAPSRTAMDPSPPPSPRGSAGRGGAAIALKLFCDLSPSPRPSPRSSAGRGIRWGRMGGGLRVSALTPQSCGAKARMRGPSFVLPREWLWHNASRMEPLTPALSPQQCGARELLTVSLLSDAPSFRRKPESSASGCRIKSGMTRVL